MELKNVYVCFDVSNQHGNRPLDCLSISFVCKCLLNYVFFVLVGVQKSLQFGVNPYLRVFPSMLPAWMVVLASTLGSRQGTLFKAPRNADVKLADSNVFARNDFWVLNCCKPTVPLPVSDLHLKEICFMVFQCFV